MNKNILLIIGLFLLTAFSVSSCSESTGEVDPYANWDQRNQKYIDSIAAVAKAKLGDGVGDWKVLRSYKLAPLAGGSITVNNNEYVYCNIKSAGNGVTPLFTDTAYVSYKGMLINNTIFNKSYSGQYKPELTVPVAFSVGGVVTGFSTALQGMKVGDIWTIYIPSDLGYGTSGSGSSIRANSTLIFDVALTKVTSPKRIE